MIRTGSNHTYLVVRPSGAFEWEWVDGREWIERSCAACGRVIDQAHEPLQQPDESRPRVVR